MRKAVLVVFGILAVGAPLAFAALPATLVIDQTKDAMPQLAIEQLGTMLIDIKDAPCMISEAGMCRIRANHMEVR
jgi:hypothetical protein